MINRAQAARPAFADPAAPFKSMQQNRKKCFTFETFFVLLSSRTVSSESLEWKEDDRAS
jgi:hypothetical protein